MGDPYANVDPYTNPPGPEELAEMEGGPEEPQAAAFERIASGVPLRRFSGDFAPRPDRSPTVMKAQDELRDPVHRSEAVRRLLSVALGPGYRGSREFQQFVEKGKKLFVHVPNERKIRVDNRKLRAFVAQNPAARKIEKWLRDRRWAPLENNKYLLLGMVEGVRYASPDERSRFRVNYPGPQSNRVTRGDEVRPFDTDDLLRTCDQPASAAPGPMMAAIQQGGVQAGGTTRTADWLRGAIWVLTSFDAPVFYTHVCRLGRVHHSSLVGGANVAAAGEWRFEHGELRWISACSGHYRPRDFRLTRAVQILIQRDVIRDQDNTYVILYRSNDQPPVPVSVRDYLDMSNELRGLRTYPV